MQEMKLRPLMKTSKVKPTITYTSIKSGKPIFIESFSEMIYAMLLDQRPSVAFFESQPQSFELELNNKKRRYTPDFHVVDKNGLYSYIEVKGSHYNASSDELEKFQYLRSCFERIGTSFHVALVDTLSHQAKNVMFLHRYKHFDNLLIKDTIPCFSGTLEHLFNKGLSESQISSLYSAMARGEISYQCNVKIGPKLEVMW